jgi:hypothetical protein
VDRVASAAVDRYRWIRYGGWGIRYGFHGRRAWSVPFVGTGVEVALKDGPRYFISSRQPMAFHRAIQDLIDSRGGARG